MESAERDTTQGRPIDGLRPMLQRLHVLAQESFRETMKYLKTLPQTPEIEALVKEGQEMMERHQRLYEEEQSNAGHGKPITPIKGST